MADVLLPDCTDLEGLQLLRIGGTKYVEQFWDYQGFALRDPAAPPQGEAKDFTWIATELARRTGLLEAYNARDQPRRRRREAVGRELRLLARADAGRTTSRRSGTRSAAPRAPSSPTAPRSQGLD